MKSLKSLIQMFQFTGVFSISTLKSKKLYHISKSIIIFSFSKKLDSNSKSTLSK